MGYREDQEEYLREREYQREQQQRERDALRTRAKWRETGRMVIVPNNEAVKTVMTKAGILLRLYSEEQTRLRTAAEMERDAWAG